MICQSCGAQIAEGQLVCDFCGTVVTKEDIRRFNKSVKSMDGKITELDTLPNRIGRILSSMVGKIFIIIIILLLIFGIIRGIFNAFLDANEEKAKEENYIQLTEYYNNGEYEKLADYYDDQRGLYSYRFNKFKEIAYLEKTLRYPRENEPNINKDGRSLELNIKYSLVYSFDALEYAYEAINDSENNNNEEILALYIEEIHDFYRDTLLLTEEEVIEMDGLGRTGEIDSDSERLQEMVTKIATDIRSN